MTSVSEETALDAECGGAGAVLSAELVEERGDVELGGALGDGECARDLLVGATIGHELEHLTLARRQLRVGTVCGSTRVTTHGMPQLGDDGAGDAGAEVGAAGVHGADGAGDLF